MNYLAHARLSFNDPHLVTGNLISDFVKGSRQYEYPVAIQQGIRLHREIDAFTDAHPAIKQIKELFYADYGRYAGAFADVCMDYFLANDTEEFENEQALDQFVIQTHQQLEIHAVLLPEKFQPVFQSMKQHHWLFHFRHEHGIEKSFRSLVKRAAYLNDSTRAFELFLEYQIEMKTLYEVFFPELKNFALQYISLQNGGDGYLCPR